MPSNDVMGGIAPCRWEPDNPTLFLLHFFTKPSSSPARFLILLVLCRHKGAPLSGPVHLLFSKHLSHLSAAAGGAHRIMFSSISRKSSC